MSQESQGDLFELAVKVTSASSLIPKPVDAEPFHIGQSETSSATEMQQQIPRTLTPTNNTLQHLSVHGDADKRRDVWRRKSSNESSFHRVVSKRTSSHNSKRSSQESLRRAAQRQGSDRRPVLASRRSSIMDKSALQEALSTARTAHDSDHSHLHSEWKPNGDSGQLSADKSTSDTSKHSSVSRLEEKQEGKESVKELISPIRKTEVEVDNRPSGIKKSISDNLARHMHHRSGSKGKGSDPNSQKSSTHNSNVFSASELPKTGSINIRKQDSKAAINRSSFLAASSVEFSKRKDSSKKNSQELLSEDRKRPISILSMKQINQLKAASRSNSVFKSGTTNSNTDILARQETAKRGSSIEIPTRGSVLEIQPVYSFLDIQATSSILEVEDFGSIHEVERQEQPPVAQPEQNQVSPEYADYLMLQQRFDSSDFIHKIESADAVWERKQKKLKIIGTFLLGDKIGRGAFAHVKEGLDSETLARVAVKIIKKNRIKKMPNGIEGVTREILLLRRLRHQNVIRLLDVYAKVEDNDGNTCVLPWFETIEQEPVFWIYDDGTEQAKDVRLNKWYIVFEFCPCSLQTLLDAAEGNKLPINEAHRYFVQLMDGLQYLHNQSVVHRDIKPANMLITNDGVLKITDFGVAEQFSQYSAEPMKTEVFAGTHQFLAPEVVDGLDICDGAPIDVWACGVTLYYMITGRLPFDSKKDGYMDLYEQISKGSYQKPAEADADLQELIRNMLEKDPTKRFTVAEIQSTFWVKAYHPQARDLPKILAYRPSQVGEDGKEDKNSPLSVPCETTMIPFLNQMYEKDIRTHLEKCGTVSTWISEEDISPTSQTIKSKRSGKGKKFIGWIKNVMHQK